MEQTSQQPIINQTNAKPKGLGLTVGLCTVLTLAGVGFGVYGMFFNSKTNTSNNNSAKEDVVTPAPEVKLPSSAKVMEFLSQFGFGSIASSNCTISPFGGAFSTKEFGMSEKIGVIISNHYKDFEVVYDAEHLANKRYIAYSVVNDAMHEYFGGDVDIEKKDYNISLANAMFLISGSKFAYDEAKDSFYYSEADGVGCAYYPSGFFNKIASIEANDDGSFVAHILSTHVAVADFMQDSYEYGINNVQNHIATRLVDVTFTQNEDEFKLVDVKIVVE